MAHAPKRVTLRDVARHANVSAATASYVLSGSTAKAARIGDETRARVLAAATVLAYVPQQSGRHLRRSVTQRVCLSLPRLSVPFYDSLASELQGEARSRGYELVVAVMREGDDTSDVVRQVQGGLADGLVVVAEQDQASGMASALSALGAMGIAVVVLGNGIEPDGFDVVMDEDDEACAEAVGYLLHDGHRRIGCLALRFDSGARHRRFDSYRRALEAYGIPFDPRLVRDAAGSRGEAHAASLDMLGSPQPPTAFFACTDIAALSAMRAAHDLGLRIPEDVAVIGAGDIAEGQYAEPPLTTVGPESSSFAGTCDLLFRRLEGTSPPTDRRIAKRWRLQKRRSA